MERSCDYCKYLDKGEEDFPCNGCTRGAVDRWKPLTNGDKIRMMDDEELANYLSTQFCHGFGKPQMAEWLKSEAKL